MLRQGQQHLEMLVLTSGTEHLPPGSRSPSGSSHVWAPVPGVCRRATTPRRAAQSTSLSHSFERQGAQVAWRGGWAVLAQGLPWVTSREARGCRLQAPKAGQAASAPTMARTAAGRRPRSSSPQPLAGQPEVWKDGSCLHRVSDPERTRERKVTVHFMICSTLSHRPHRR